MNIGHWTTTKAALAVAGLLAIGGAVGSAVAFSPIIATPYKFLAPAEFYVRTTESGLKRGYIVPAGKRFVLTDVIASNFSATTQVFSIFSGAGGVCGGTLTPRLRDVLSPSQNTAVLTFQTGIVFGAGQAVCIAPSDAFGFDVRGFLYTAS